MKFETGDLGDGENRHVTIVAEADRVLLQAGPGNRRGYVHLTRSQALAVAGALKAMADTFPEAWGREPT